MNLHLEGGETRVLISAEGGAVTSAYLIECFLIRASV